MEERSQSLITAHSQSVAIEGFATPELHGMAQFLARTTCKGIRDGANHSLPSQRIPQNRLLLDSGFDQEAHGKCVGHLGPPKLSATQQRGQLPHEAADGSSRSPDLPRIHKSQIQPAAGRQMDVLIQAPHTKPTVPLGEKQRWLETATGARVAWTDQ
eukprot:15345975-Ditylum_brightwellii.AAC.2